MKPFPLHFDTIVDRADFHDRKIGNRPCRIVEVQNRDVLAHPHAEARERVADAIDVVGNLLKGQLALG